MHVMWGVVAVVLCAITQIYCPIDIFQLNCITGECNETTVFFNTNIWNISVKDHATSMCVVGTNLLACMQLSRLLHGTQRKIFVTQERAPPASKQCQL